MEVEIIKDNVKYNKTGTPGGHVISNKGDIVTVPFPVGKTMIDLGQAREVSGKPQAQSKVVTPSEAKQKATYIINKKGAGWYAIVDEDGDTVEKIRGEYKAKERLGELNAE